MQRRGRPKTPDPGTSVRRAGPEDWEQVRAMRLAALAESPTAFASSLAREQAYEDEDWREWTRGAATFVAFHGDEPVGMAGVVPGDNADERQLVAAWVHPDHRRTGVATALVAAVEQWAREHGAARLTLWVTTTNEPAQAVYRAKGFTPSGRSKPLPSNPALTEDELVLELT
jgi:GNAT superfamily N-acetyltransferase